MASESVIFVQKKITYEQPLNERIRTFLRLEFLFQQAYAHLANDSVWDSRATLNSILEILSIFSRADLKTEVMKELERQITVLERLEQNPGVDRQRLGSLLSDMDALIDHLHASKGQIGQELRQNEFLNSIRQRSSIPGGTCDFDLPAYHYWLQQPPGMRRQQLERWLKPFSTIAQSISLILRLIRDSAPPAREVAEAGFFQKTLEPTPPCHIVRVTVPADSPYFAEISGGKHRFTVRFMEQRIDERPVQTMENVSFELTCCTI